MERWNWPTTRDRTTRAKCWTCDGEAKHGWRESRPCETQQASQLVQLRRENGVANQNTPAAAAATRRTLPQTTYLQQWKKASALHNRTPNDLRPPTPPQAEAGPTHLGRGGWPDFSKFGTQIQRLDNNAHQGLQGDGGAGGDPPVPERAEWHQMDAGLRRALLHLHTTTGHPSNEALQRLLRQGRAKKKPRGRRSICGAVCVLTS